MYFTNGEQVQWSDPGDDVGWAKHTVRAGAAYWVNAELNQTSWLPPTPSPPPDENTSCAHVNYCGWHDSFPSPWFCPFTADPLVCHLSNEVYHLHGLMHQIAEELTHVRAAASIHDFQTLKL